MELFSQKESNKILKTGKAAGPDSIDNRLLKELSGPLSTPLTDLFNFSLATGKVPSLWKQAHVTPMFKKNDPSDVANYRPIPFFNTIGKVLEKIVHKYVCNFLNDHHVITTLQSGFVPGDSTVNQLVDIYNTFARPWTQAKKSEQFSVILVRPSTGSGKKVFFLN